jgi:hypothetical protein
VAQYFGIDAANERLVELQPLLEQLRADRDRIAEIKQELDRRRETNGSSDHAQELAELEDEIRQAVRRMQMSVAQIDVWGVTLRDISTGLIDFPALAMGRPIWLCWRIGDGDQIGWWHEANAGFDSRQPLSELT